MKDLVVAIAGTLAFSMLFALNWSRSKSLLDPAVAISAVWSACFLFLVLSGERLFGVSWTALLIFITGLGFFSFGVVLGKGISVNSKRLETYGSRSDIVVLWMFLLILLLGLPLYLASIRQLTGAPLFSPAYFLEVRQGTLMQDAENARSPLVYNLVPFSSIAAMLAFALTESGRRSKILIVAIVVLALLYNLLTGAKAGPVQLVILLLTIYGVQRGRLPKLALLAAGSLVVVLFGAVTVQRAASIGVKSGSIGASVSATLEQFGNYFASGPVGFSVYLDDPQLVPPVWSPWRFFQRTANYFGNYFDVPIQHANFVEIGSGLYYNTYSAFFSYFPPYGPLGVGGFMLALGVLSGAAYRRAQQGRLIWLLLYASLYSGILKTVFSESLLLALNPTLKLLIVAATVLLLRRLRFRRKSAITVLARSPA